MSSGVIPSQTVYTGASSGVGSAAARLMGRILREGANHFFCLSSGNRIVMRTDIPIERWFMDHLAPFESEGNEWKARGWALIATLEGSLYVIYHAALLFFTACRFHATQEEVQIAREKWQAQLNGWLLGFSACIDPRDFKHHVDRSLHANEQQPILGCRPEQLQRLGWTAYAPSRVEAT